MTSELQVPLDNLLSGIKGQVPTDQLIQENVQTPDGSRNSKILLLQNPLRRTVICSAWVRKERKSKTHHKTPFSTRSWTRRSLYLVNWPLYWCSLLHVVREQVASAKVNQLHLQSLLIDVNVLRLDVTVKHSMIKWQAAWTTYYMMVWGTSSESWPLDRFLRKNQRGMQPLELVTLQA